MQNGNNLFSYDYDTIISEVKLIIMEQVKNRTMGKLTEEQIQKIEETVENIDFNSMNIQQFRNIPEIEVTTNPYEFEENSRNREEILEHSWAGTRSDTTETEVIIGDYTPGISSFYEYSNNGEIGSPEETYEMSDFSLNETQVSLVSSVLDDTFNRDEAEYAISLTIQIYIPEEEKYPNSTSFKDMVISKRRQKFCEDIQNRTNGKLTEEQIQKIAESIDFESKMLPEIEVTTNPYKFEENSRNRKEIFEHSWAGTRSDTTETEVIIGDYTPGISSSYEYSNNGENSSPEERYEMSDFLLNNLQVALVKKDEFDNFNRDTTIDESSITIQIYIPEEEKYLGNVRFKDMITDKNHQKSSTEVIDTVVEQTEQSTTAGEIQKVAGDIIKGQHKEKLSEEQNKDISGE